jgi:hypothetical protein
MITTGGCDWSMCLRLAAKLSDPCIWQALKSDHGLGGGASTAIVAMPAPLSYFSAMSRFHLTGV